MVRHYAKRFWVAVRQRLWVRIYWVDYLDVYVTFMIPVPCRQYVSLTLMQDNLTPDYSTFVLSHACSTNDCAPTRFFSDN